jgi:hypothetical protein
VIYIKKQIVSLLIFVLLFASISGASNFQNNINNGLNAKLNDQNYTHTVFAGIAATQSCGPCHNWTLNIYDTYLTGLYDFEYASMIGYDTNGNVLNYDAVYWSLNYTVGLFPTTIIDGDYERISGDHIEQLPEKLNSCGNRSVANITANITAFLIGNATFNITITIENNEDTQYGGYIRVFITEIISRYETSLGEPFKFGFLDFAFDESITINPGEIYTDYTIWNGYDHEDAHGDDFGDLKANNIQLALVVYNNSNGYVDNTKTTLIPNNPPNRPIDPFPENGSIDVRGDPDLYWNCTDPDGDDLVYDVYLGTTNPPSLIASNITDPVFDPGILEFLTTYYWYIVSKDNRGGTNQSSIWTFTTKLNYIPDPPAVPFGPSIGNVGEELEYVTSTNDMDDDDVFYWFFWDDGNNSGWVGPFESGEIANASHVYTEGGDYKIKAKAKDVYGGESLFSLGYEVHITEPELEIINVTGGLFRISADINNIGDGEANEVEWRIYLHTGIVIIGRETQSNIDNILPDGKENIISKPIIGLGKTKIIIEANPQYGNSASIEMDAFMLGCFIIIR